MQSSTLSEDEKALAIMAHDLKAPLSAIVSILGVIEKGYVTDMAKTRELVSRASHKAELLIAIVDDILDYTLLADKSMMKRERVNLFEILGECIGMMKSYADSRGITITVSRDISGEKMVIGNDTFLMRAFNNIIGNAIKYNKEKGSVNIDHSQDTKKNTVSITITDTGIGIPEEEIEKVFKIFERGKFARRNIDGSLGLGMSLVRQIVEDHYGRVNLSSTVGVGTAITVTLPLLNDKKEDNEGGTTNVS